MAMAEKEEPREGEASRQESFLDQFLRRLDQTDQEAAASTSGATTMSAAPSPSSDTYSSLPTSVINPWSFVSTPHPGSPLNLDLPTQAALHSLTYRAPYSLPANPLAEFPWLLEEFDQQQRLVAGDPDAHDSAERLYSSYTAQEPQAQIPRPSSSQGDPFKDEPARRESASSIQAGGHGSSSAKLDAGPVPRFGEPGSTQTGASTPAVSKQMNYRPPTSPLPSDATAVGGSVTTSAGTSNTSLSSESTSNAGDEDESEVKEDATEGASSGKRKKPEAESAGAAGETPESKKSDQPK